MSLFINNRVSNAGSNSASIFILLAILYFYNPSNVLAQEKSDYAIEAIANAYERDSIAIRWAPNNPLAWTLCNQYGYYVQRITLTKNGKVQQEREVVNLFNTPHKPRPVNEWEEQIENNDLMAIAAQAIYGETFELTDNFSSDIMQVINKSKENEQRFSFALFAADMSQQVAKWSALSYTDVNVEKDAGYLYKIYSAVPENIMKIDTGYVFIQLEDYKPLPQPQGLQAKVEEQTAMLSWDQNATDNIYVAYKLERAINKPENFETVSKLPIVNTMQSENSETAKGFKRDSIPQNNASYFYRLRGLTPFGDVGPPSDTVEVVATQPMTAAASISSYTIDIANNHINLKWEYETTAESILRGFNILRSAKPDEGFQKINKTLLSPSTRTFTDPLPENTNYYKVEMEGMSGQIKVSQPFLVQLEDSIPPAIPENLKFSIDSLGLVSLSWDENKEADLLGYKVYRSNFKNSEFSEITSSPIADNYHQDQISLKTLSGKIYYKIVALDNRYNPSAFSASIEVRKPDIVPPVPPQIKQIESTSDGVNIKWNMSSSTDVAAHLLYRKQHGQDDWNLIKRMNDSTQSYLDKSPISGLAYQYKLTAIDENGLESLESNPLSIVARVAFAKDESFEVNVNPDKGLRIVQFQMNYKKGEPEKLLIYRATAAEPLSLYKEVKDMVDIFEDKGLSPDIEYIYRIQAVYKNGIPSEFSEAFKVKL